MPYLNLLFDADDTLFDFPRAERQAFFGVCRAMGIPDAESAYQLYSGINQSLWQQFNAGRISHAQLLETRFPRFLSAAGLSLDGEACNRLHEEGLARGSFLLPQAEEVCRALAETRRLYLVTNATAGICRSRLAGSAIAPYFRQAFISEEMGLRKPDAAYFAAVLSRIPGAAADNTLVIGDSLSADIQGAANAGLRSCWYNPRGLPRPAGAPIDREIRQLRELLAIV